MRLCYVANARLPTEKAHGLQIVENCDALARAGVEVTLIVPRRVQPAAWRRRDLWSHYGVEPAFRVRRVACVDLLWLGRGVQFLASRLQMLTFAAAAAFAARRTSADWYFGRETVPLLALGLIARRPVVYEAHTLAPGGAGSWLQRRLVRRAALVVAVTERLAEDLQRAGARQVVVLRDGFRPARFSDLLSRDAARAATNVPADAFCAGYLGQLETMGAGKGLELVVDAIRRAGSPRIHLALIGGPEARARRLRARWRDAGLGDDAFHWIGDLPPGDAARLLPAFDACLLPLPWTNHFAYYASPLKLFEYMAAGGAIIATALPSLSEVVRSGESAILVQPGDIEAMAAALARLRDDPSFRESLAARARDDAGAFTWDVRACRLVAALRSIA
jgi:glycosyltransferase involved in cell wall biosynthesis